MIIVNPTFNVSVPEEDISDKFSYYDKIVSNFSAVKIGTFIVISYSYLSQEDFTITFDLPQIVLGDNIIRPNSVVSTKYVIIDRFTADFWLDLKSGVINNLGNAFEPLSVIYCFQLSY